MKQLILRLLIFTLANLVLACGYEEANDITTAGSFSKTDTYGEGHLQDSETSHATASVSTEDSTPDICVVVFHNSQGWSDEEIAIYVGTDYPGMSPYDLTQELNECGAPEGLTLSILRNLGTPVREAVEVVRDITGMTAETAFKILVEAGTPYLEIASILADLFEFTGEQIGEIFAEAVASGDLIMDIVIEEIKEDAALLAHFIAAVINFGLDVSLRDILIALGKAFEDATDGAAKLIKVIIDSGLATAENLAEIIEFLIVEMNYKIDDVAQFIKAAVNAGLDLTLRHVLTAIATAFENGVIAVKDVTKLLIESGLATAQNLAKIIEFLVTELGLKMKNVAEFVKAAINAGLDLSIRDVLFALGQGITKISDLVEVVAEAGLLTAKNLAEAFGILITDFGATAKELFNLAIKFVLDTSPRDVIEALVKVGAISIGNFFKLGGAILDAACGLPVFNLSPHCWL